MPDLQRAAARFVEAFGFRGRRLVYLTRGDGTGNLITMDDGVTILPGRDIWVHNDGDQGRAAFAVILPDGTGIIRQNDRNYEGVPVWIGKPPGETRDQVLPWSGGEAARTAFSQGTPMEMAIASSFYSTTKNLATLRPGPVDSTGFRVKVDGPYFYTKPSTGLIQALPTTIISLAARQAALTSGQHQFTWICLDQETGTLVDVPGTATAAVYALPSRDEFTPAALTAVSVTDTYKRLCPVYLYYGQTSVLDVDYYRTADARLEFPLPTVYLSTKTTRSANTILSGPSSGAAAAPTFRTLVNADLASLIAGAAASTIKTSGPLFYSATQTGNATTTETDLFNVSIAANTLNANGETIEFYVAGTFAATANNKRLRAYWGATTLLDTGALAITTAQKWEIRGVIMRTGATTQKSTCSIITSDAALVATTNYQTPGETLSGAVALRITGQGTANNDIVGELLKGYWNG